MRGSRLWKNGWVACTALTVAIAGVAVSAASDRQKSPKDQPSMATKAPSQARPANRIAEKLAAMDAVGTPIAEKKLAVIPDAMREEIEGLLVADADPVGFLPALEADYGVTLGLDLKSPNLAGELKALIVPQPKPRVSPPADGGVAGGGETCATAVPLGLGSHVGSLLGQPADVGDGPSPSCGSLSNVDDYYTFTSTCPSGNAGTATVSMCAGAFDDSILAVFTDCAGGQIICDDDGCPGDSPPAGPGFLSTASWATVGGTGYIIRVSPWGSTGTLDSYQLDVSEVCPVCGDGIVDAPEQCDDGNVISGDGCNATCQEEGACCVKGVGPSCSCQDLTSADCALAGGFYRGDASLCGVGLDGDCDCNGNNICDQNDLLPSGGTLKPYPIPVDPDVAIPDAGVSPCASCPGACVDTNGDGILGPAPDRCGISHTFVVPDSGIISDVNVDFELGPTPPNLTGHTWYGDIICVITHGGVTVVALSDPATGDSSDVQGVYVLDDEAATTFDAAAVAAGTLIPSGSYRPDNPLSAFDGLDKVGPWTISFADDVGGDVGSLLSWSLEILNSASPPVGTDCNGNDILDSCESPDPSTVGACCLAAGGCALTTPGACVGPDVFQGLCTECSPGACPSVCGNGSVEGSEECDDGNLVNNDGCDSACLWEGACCKCAGSCSIDSEADCLAANGRYKGDQSVCTGPGAVTCDVCGDSVIGPDEECDDGNATPGDGCDSCCQNEAPANDDCTGALAVAVPGSGPVQSNADANDDTTGTCTVSSPNQGLWYTVVGNGNTITVSTCNAPTTDYDTMIQVWCDCPATACVGGNDDQTGSDPLCETTGVVGTNRGSTVSFCSVLGHTYYVLVGGFSASTGTHQLDATEDGVSCTPTVTCAPAVCGNGIIEAGEQCDDGNVNNGDGCDSLCQLEPATNDDCIDRINITDGATAFDNSTATTDGVAEASCNFAVGDDQIHNDLWYNYTATCDGLLVIDTCAGGSFDTRLAVYAGWTCPPGAAPLACDDDDDTNTNLCGGTLESVITLPVTLGDQLKIRVGEFSSTTTSGPDVLNVACTNPVCGNGTLEIGEQCDDGNVADGDGCSSTCQNEGACCDGSSCVVTTSSGCTGLGGVYQGDGVACGTQCSFGACCLPANAGCDEVSADCCAELGGTFQGGATCADVNCPCDVTCDPGKTPENEADCGLPTDTVNGGCNSPSGGGASNCCIANGGLGCDDATCQAAVCAIDSFCCDTEWDSVCAGQALTSCPVLCPAPTFVDFGTIACGGGVCGSVQVDATAGQRDTDWYQATLAVDSAVTWTVTAEFPVLVAIVDSDAGALCADETYVVVASAVGTPCEEVVVSATLVAGTYEFLVLPSSFAVDIACGTQYTASLACSTPPATPTGACCGDPPAPGCSCTVQTEADCATAGGFYKGDGTVCGGNICDCNNNGACDQFDVVPVGGTVKPYPIDNPDLAVPDAGASPCGTCAVGEVCIDVNGDGNIGPSPDRCGVEHTFNVPDSGTIFDVNVDFTFAPEHTFHADVIMIVSHNGVRVTLMDGSGLTTDLNGTYVLDDEAAVAMDAAPDADANGDIDLGTYRPDGLLSAFDGLNKLGDWTISVADDVGTDTGTLASWSLEILNDATLVSQDCNGDSIPDSCQLAGNDCNSNSIPDDCELAGNDSLPPGGDGKPDDCNCAVDGDCPSGQTCNPCTNVCEGPAGFPCVTAIDCRNDAVNNNGCNCAQCISNVCVYNCVKFGNTNCAGPLNPNLDDILCVLAGFGNFNSCPNGDIAPCGGNNIINLDDILAVLNAFGGGNPCGCQNPPGTPPLCGGP